MSRGDPAGRFAVYTHCHKIGRRSILDRPGGLYYKPCRNSLSLGNVGGIPSAAQSLNQQDARSQTARQQIHHGLFIGQRRGLRGDHRQIIDGARFVLIGRDVERVFRRLGG